MSKLQVVVGGQFGSEAKGAVAGHLASWASEPLCVRVAGPNAGHTVVNPITGVRHALRQIPVGLVTNPNATGAIAAGSEIDIEVLDTEIRALEADGIKVRDRLTIDPQATILDEGHRSEEQQSDLVARIGSTGKGIGSARAARIRRMAMIAGDMRGLGMYGEITQVADAIRAEIKIDGLVQIEGTQGYGLGLHAGYYPHCTSSDCTALDFMAMAQANPWNFDETEIWIVFRPYPIRVAGSSGPLAGETTWEKLGLPQELTTVTKKIRRVGTWDPDLARAAVEANGGQHAPIKIALTMADQIDPALAGTTTALDLVESSAFAQFAHRVTTDTGYPLDLVTTSDRTCIDLRGRWAAFKNYTE